MGNRCKSCCPGWAEAALLMAAKGASVLCFAAFLLPQDTEARTRVTNRTEIRDYRVYGETAGELVSYMKRRPFRGDNGPAMANIRPRYKLQTKTTKSDKGCRISHVALDIRFILTLPKAVESSKHTGKTKMAWRSFRAFARRHEQVHRKIYLNCARRFVSDVLRVPAMRSCRSLERKAKSMLRQQEKVCDKKHLAFDRREFRRVPSLTLFRQARQEKNRLYSRVSKRQKISRKSARRTARPTWFRTAR